MASNPRPQDYSILVLFSPADEAFVATSPEFPGLSAFGDTHAEVQSELYLVIEGAIEIFMEDGYPVPVPVTNGP